MSRSYTPFTGFCGEVALLRSATVCIGSGRFLRAVLVPVVDRLGGVIIAQPRGTSFVSYLAENNGIYEVDTVEESGTVATSRYQVQAVGSLSKTQDKAALLTLASRLRDLRIVGVGVTEAGFQENSQSIMDLAELLHAVYRGRHCSRLSVINTDNLPMNGSKLRSLVFNTGLCSSDTDFASWLERSVIFHNTMVDRITSHRAQDEQIPRAEPLPSKAIVIEDLTESLPATLTLSPPPGVVICRTEGELGLHVKLKLLIANATHTAMVYGMALSWCKDTSSCRAHPVFITLVDRVFWDDILPSFEEKDRSAAEKTFTEWRKRLQHPFFGLSTFFVAQNATQKIVIRLLPSIKKGITEGRKPSRFMAYSLATILRFLTPMGQKSSADDGVFLGLLPPSPPHLEGNKEEGKKREEPDKVHYAGKLYVDFTSGIYSFRNDSHPEIPPILQMLANGRDPLSMTTTLSSLLSSLFDIKISSALWTAFFRDVSQLYVDMLDREAKLKTIPRRDHLYLVQQLLGSPCPSHTPSSVVSGEYLRHAVIEAAEKVPVIDLHTHLFPPSHGSLMMYGVDELLTYHYLVAEYFMVAPASMTPEKFYSLSKEEQADLVWEELFIRRLPLSEACRGVLTTLQELGQGERVQKRDLCGIRAWTRAQDPQTYVDLVFKTANIKYVVMTNIPYVEAEASVWLKPVRGAPKNDRFRSALRIDLFLLPSSWVEVKRLLTSQGYEGSAEGAKLYLQDWIQRMKPEYFMASTPPGFAYPASALPNDTPDLLENVILPLAVNHRLPVALKLGAVRGLNPALGAAGDGVAKAELRSLSTLCRRHPEVKFLATCLSRDDQHEICVLANKFRNLHLYGCWWYCNNPSIIESITHMGVEMLGSAFTAQHSDARVLDQLIYKWKHSRKVIGEVLAQHFEKLWNTGWRFTMAEIEREVARFLGGSYEEFLAK